MSTASTISFEEIESNRIVSNCLCCLALIDPDVKNEDRLEQILQNINNSNFSGILVGGSLIMDDKFELRAKYIFENTDLPIFIFPGSSNQVTAHCNFLLYLTLLSGRNPQYLISEHVKSAPRIYNSNIETISTGSVGRAIALAQSSWFGVGGVKFRSIELNEGCFVDSLAFGAHRREIFAEIGGYDEEMNSNQDDEFNLRAIQAGKKIWMDPSIKTKYNSRSSFIMLFKQYFNYGYYKVRGIQKRRQVIAIRHLIPTAFIIGLIVSLIFGYIFHHTWFSFSVFGIYMIINIFFSINT